MSPQDRLQAHRLPLGEIDYAYAVSTAEPDSDIDVVTRCEAAAELIKTGVDEGLISEREGLLVVGGGASGLTAVMTALKLKVGEVHLSNDGPLFASQRGCTHRFLHPHIYRWPDELCTKDKYEPLFGSGYGLEWKADIAAKVADEWVTQTAFIDDLGNFDRQHPIPEGSKVSNIGEVNRLLVHPTIETQSYGMVVFCIAPREKVAIGTTFSGSHFWADDDLDSTDCGCEENLQSVLFIGTGDGALQDFLRVCCPQKKIDLLHVALEYLLAASSVGCAVRSELEKLHAKRGTLKSEEIHFACARLANDINEDSDSASALDAFFAEVCEQCPEEREFVITSRKNFFGKCYLLNRFLVLLICARHKKQNGREIYLPGGEIQEVRDSTLPIFKPDDFCLNGKRFGKIVPRLGTTRSQVAASEETLYLEKKPEASRE